MKLAILSDTALVKPKSGSTFVQGPEDQELLPGVEGAIAALIADGYTLAIASNQGGCQKQEISTADLKVGMSVWSTTNIFLGTVTEIKSTIFYCGDQGYSIRYDSKVLASWKTLESAIAEMRYCLELLSSIKIAYFCPDDGWWCHSVKQPNFYSSVSAGHDECAGFEFRKPGSGMLKLAIRSFGATEAIMIGDRPEDEQAAQATGISFMWADEWRKPFI